LLDKYLRSVGPAESSQRRKFEQLLVLLPTQVLQFACQKAGPQAKRGDSFPTKALGKIAKETPTEVGAGEYEAERIRSTAFGG
jgi:hypothetical protein